MASKRVLPVLLSRPLRSSPQLSAASLSRLVAGTTLPRHPARIPSSFLLPRDTRLSSSSSAASSPPKAYTFDDMKELISAPIPSRLLIDVREPAEVAQSGRIPGSVLMPINSNPDAVYLDPEDFEEEFGFEKPGQKEDGTAQGPDEVVFYCRIGVRSKVAMQQALGEGGWKGIKAGEYGGGMIEWAGKGGEVERIGKKMAA